MSAVVPHWMVAGPRWLKMSAVVPSAVALAADIIVLWIMYAIWRDKNTRPRLRRQSLGMIFVVILVDIVNNIFYGATYFLHGPSFWCGAVVSVSVSCDVFNHFVVMLIAVNLQLVLVHGISTAGFMRYYLGGAVLATVAIAIPPAVSGVWGWNTEGHVCFIARPDAELRRWDILAVQAWTATAVLVAMLCTAAVLAKLVRMRRRLRRDGPAPDALQSAQLAAVAWRIALYPAVLFVVNAVAIPTMMWLTFSGGPTNETTFILLCSLTALYAVGHLALAIVAIFADPALSAFVLRRARPRPSSSPVIEISFTRTTDLEFDPESTHAPPAKPRPAKCPRTSSVELECTPFRTAAEERRARRSTILSLVDAAPCRPGVLEEL